VDELSFRSEVKERSSDGCETGKNENGKMTRGK